MMIVVKRAERRDGGVLSRALSQQRLHVFILLLRVLRQSNRWQARSVRKKVTCLTGVAFIHVRAHAISRNNEEDSRVKINRIPSYF